MLLPIWVYEDIKATAKLWAEQRTHKGGIIGWVAALLGVGGSVMTVPLLRRRGSSMAEAAAIANILTLPLSFTATLTYCVLSLWQSTWTPTDLSV